MKHVILCSLIFCSIQFLSAQTLSFTVANASGSNSITCAYPALSYTATSTHTTSSVNYTWTNGTTISTGPNYTITSPGTYTVLASAAPTLASMQVFTIFSNTTAPSATVSPTSLTLNCNVNAQNTVNAQTTSSINTSHLIVSPNGSSVTANNLASYTYSVVAPGTYTHFLTDNTNGCVVSNTFVASSPFAGITFSFSSPQNFTLGCNNQGLAIVSCYPIPPPGGLLSYTVIGPNTSTNYPSGPLSPNNFFSLTTAGTYTYIVRDNTTMCVTILPFTITGTNAAMFPQINLGLSTQTLSCNVPSVSILASSQISNTTYSWTLQGNPGSASGASLTALTNTMFPNSTIAGVYTLTATDINSSCESDTVLTIFQNLFPPNAAIGNPMSTSLTCINNDVILTNISLTGIPPGSGFPSNLPVITFSWLGPVTTTLNNSSTYTASVGGTYTLIAQDSNNGCKSSATYSVSDIRAFPQILENNQAFNICSNTQVTIFPMLQSPNAPYNYSWTVPSGANVSGLSSMSITVSVPGIYTVAVKNSLGCVTNASIDVVYCVGIKDIDEKNHFQLYPNPCTDAIQIKMSTGNTLRKLNLYSATGQHIFEAPFNAKDFEISTSQLAKGIYFLSLEFDNGNSITKKLIKE